MRFLKNKIAAATAAAAKQSETQHIKDVLTEKSMKKHEHSKECLLSENLTKPLSVQDKEKKRRSSSSKVSDPSRGTKNLIKNYGQAISRFSISSIGKPYLVSYLKAEKVKFNVFVKFVKKCKTKIDGLFHFRELLLPHQTDDPKTIACKRIFQKISEVFIKYFSVNWIFNSKMKYKKVHLDFRFKVLRRIKSPQLFTYLNAD